MVQCTILKYSPLPSNRIFLYAEQNASMQNCKIYNFVSSVLIICSSYVNSLQTLNQQIMNHCSNCLQLLYNMPCINIDKFFHQLLFLNLTLNVCCRLSSPNTEAKTEFGVEDIYGATLVKRSRRHTLENDVELCCHCDK